MSSEKALQPLPYSHAQVVETWMASVDAFFQLKEEDNSNGYLGICSESGPELKHTLSLESSNNINMKSWKTCDNFDK